MDVQLIDIKHAEETAVAILFDVEPDMFLKEIRNVVLYQVSEIISSNDYRFHHGRFGAELSKTQQSSVTLRNIAVTSDDG